MKIRPKPDNICSYFGTGGFFPGQVDASLRELQSATGEELRLRTLLPLILDKAFKGEL